MFLVQLKNGLPIAIHKSIPDYLKMGEWSADWQTRNDWTSFDEVVRLAGYITAMQGEVYIGIDSGEGVAPRFDIIKIPKVGDKVSRAFNGDYYPDGAVVSVSKKLQVTTSGGETYRRKGNTGVWKAKGGVWNLIPGHRDELNPSF